MPRSKKSKSKATKKSNAISWVLHALKIVMGDESIRQEILLHYHPTLHRGNITAIRRIDPQKHGKEHVFTFDAFVKTEENDASFDVAIERKRAEIRKYLSEIIQMKGVIVFTATNIQQYAEDYETHFQTFIVDNNKKTVLAIDPAYEKTALKASKKNNILTPNQGIYYAEVAHEVIKPFFQENAPDYEFKMFPLSHPAQIAFDDVFCQSWSLYILDSLLTDPEIEEFEIPETQIEKYGMILRFYKRVFKDIPILKNYLKFEYEGEIIDNFGDDSDFLKENPAKILMEMTKNDMEDTD
jgi:hypothetical protein